MDLQNNIEKITKSLSISQCQENEKNKENKKLNISITDKFKK